MEAEPACDLRRVERLGRGLELGEDLNAPGIAQGAMPEGLVLPYPIGP
jgi:hypothetical protein